MIMINRLRTIVFPNGKYNKLYTQYVGWSFVSTILVSAESAMSTHSLLHAINTESETLRTMNYVGKDIIGQLGGLGYMAKMGEKSDKEPLKFLNYSNIIQQSSYMIICATPFCPEYFLPLAGFSNILSNISYTGYGAINAKCIQKLATDDNIGEIYAKITVINTLGSSIGLIFGLGITACFPDHGSRFLLLPFLAVGRVYTFNRAIKGLI